jgi:hypothetical protein
MLSDKDEQCSVKTGEIRVCGTAGGLVWCKEYENMEGKKREMTKVQVMNGFSSKLRSLDLIQ